MWGDHIQECVGDHVQECVGDHVQEHTSWTKYGHLVKLLMEDLLSWICVSQDVAGTL